MCVFIYACAQVHTHLYACMWMPTFYVWCLPQSFTTLLFKTNWLSSPIWLDWLAAKQRFFCLCALSTPSTRLMHAATSGFVTWKMEIWFSSSSPHSKRSPEPSPQPSEHLFYVVNSSQNKQKEARRKRMQVSCFPDRTLKCSKNLLQSQMEIGQSATQPSAAHIDLRGKTEVKKQTWQPRHRLEWQTFRKSNNEVKLASLLAQKFIRSIQDCISFSWYFITGNDQTPYFPTMPPLTLAGQDGT